MHNHSNVRYVFISYEDLKEIKFKKLEKVCDKIFIVINEGVDNLPFSLVRKIQKLGKNAKWIQISEREDALSLSISFLMGQMHEKINKEIEFAILSNDKQYDSIVEYLNSVGRNCIRVKNKKKTIASFSNSESTEEKNIPHLMNEVISNGHEINDIQTVTKTSSGNTAIDMLASTNGHQSYTKEIKVAAKETIKRLIRSGNRPSELSLLKSYIILHNQSDEIEDSIEEIIDHLANTKEIEIQEDEVIYNF